MKKQWIVGIDIGGTKIAVSLGTRRGKVLGKTVFASGKSKKAPELFNRIQFSISELLSEYGLKKQHLLGIGVAVPGAIEPRRQMVLKSPNSPCWEHFQIRPALVRKFRVPVVVENDANAAALGESYFGLGRNIDHFLYVTVSTGIGSGIVSNGRLVRGASGTAGEIGHTTIVKGGLPCHCGKRGCLEAYASGTAIGEYVRQAIKKGARSAYFKKIKLKDITGQLVSQAARAGDHLAIQARAVAADFLGIGLANVINLLNPKRIILGGGVMEHVDHFWSPMMRAVRREAWPVAFQSCKFVCSKLGKNVGDLGAMALVLEAQNKNKN